MLKSEYSYEKFRLQRQYESSSFVSAAELLQINLRLHILNGNLM